MAGTRQARFSTTEVWTRVEGEMRMRASERSGLNEGTSLDRSNPDTSQIDVRPRLSIDSTIKLSSVGRNH